MMRRDCSSNFFDEHRKQINIEDDVCSLYDNISCPTGVQSDNLEAFGVESYVRQSLTNLRNAQSYIYIPVRYT